MLAITRYSGEIEEAQARIQLLESKLTQQEDSETRSLIVSLAQELRTPLTSLAGYTDLLLNESMGILILDFLCKNSMHNAKKIIFSFNY
jgi:signal transduction histidine kinase